MTPQETTNLSSTRQDQQESPQMRELLADLYREFGCAADPKAPLTGVSLCLTHVGKEPIVATTGAANTPHAHGIEAAAAHVRMALRAAADPRLAALLDKAARILDAASHLKSGTFFETNTKH